MFSEFVNFKDIAVLINNDEINSNFGLFPLDISHDNEVYQVFLTSQDGQKSLNKFTELLNEPVSRDEDITLEVKFELKKSRSEIIDLYCVLPGKKNMIMTRSTDNKNVIVFKCLLKSRNYANFDYMTDRIVNY
jgi:hypothetical protein